MKTVAEAEKILNAIADEEQVVRDSRCMLEAKQHVRFCADKLRAYVEKNKDEAGRVDIRKMNIRMSYVLYWSKQRNEIGLVGDRQHEQLKENISRLRKRINWL